MSLQFKVGKVVKVVKVGKVGKVVKSSKSRNKSKHLKLFPVAQLVSGKGSDTSSECLVIYHGSNLCLCN